MGEELIPTRTQLAFRRLADPSTALGLVALDAIPRATQHDTAVADCTTARPLHEPPSRLPLPTAAWYAVNLASAMLGREDAELLAAAMGIETRAALLDWCERCGEVIASDCGRERADLFWDRVCAVLRPREARVLFEEQLALD